jgi:hypothetical protein
MTQRFPILGEPGSRVEPPWLDHATKAPSMTKEDALCIVAAYAIIGVEPLDARSERAYQQAVDVVTKSALAAVDRARVEYAEQDKLASSEA